MLLLAGLLGLPTWGRQGAVVHVALLPVVVLGFRAWARRCFLGGGRDRGR
ncbi:hypothetical protein ACI789_01850 [Geodermatophilus sp. SYSU D00965]